MKIPFHVKSDRLDVLSLHLSSGDLGAIEAHLNHVAPRVGELRALPLVLNIHASDVTGEQLPELIQLFRAKGFIVAALRHENEAWAAIGARHGLAFSSDNMGAGSLESIAKQVENQALQQALSLVESQKNQTLLALQEEVAALKAALIEEGQNQALKQQAAAENAKIRGTMIVDTPIRSGQKIYARGGDLIVTARVSEGAEILADGNIHIYAPLYGRAIAGASGRVDTRIFVQEMRAQLVSIARNYHTFENGLPPNLAGQPAHIYLDNNRIVAVHALTKEKFVAE